MPDDISLYFVLPSHCEDELGTSEEMQEAFEGARQNHMNPEWVRECDIGEHTYKKQNLIIFEKFEGQAFKNASKNKCLRIIGPRCLLTALVYGVSIPSNGAPVYNMALGDIKISITCFSTEKKKDLQHKIELMGGLFSLHVTSSVQYLISHGVTSQKYVMAVNSNIPIMSESWIHAVWEESLKRYVKGTEEEYLIAHKLPTFHNLSSSATGLAEHERNEIKNLVEANGGTFSGKMTITKTKILICKTGVKSEKFTVAIKNNITCVTTSWIYDSVKAGVALNTDDYAIKISSSTPTKAGIAADLDFSTMSAITGPSDKPNNDVTIHSVNSTNMSIYCPMTTFNHSILKSAPRPTKLDTKEDCESLIINIDLKDVKSAGPFLDGCSIYLAGFNSASREKLCRILKVAGATRYDDLSDRITQVIAGDVSSHEFKLLSTKGCIAPIVSVKWLLESIRIQCPAFEDNYIVSVKGSPALEAPSSPMVKKGLNLLRSNTSMVDPNKEVLSKCLNFDPEPDANETIMKQYLNKAKDEEEDTLARLIAQGNFDDVTKRNKTKADTIPVVPVNEPNETSEMEEEETFVPFFKDKSLILVGFSESDYKELVNVIEQRCGIVKTTKYKGIPDYVVVPTFIDDLKISASEIVNHLWVLDCDVANRILTTEYYHQPFVDNLSSKPLQNCVITISNYLKSERVYLREILDHLGAEYQEKFAKTAQAGVKGSTHLICLTPTGKKYDAAIKWGIPVTTGKWLLECLRLDCKVDEKLFKLGENNEQEIIVEKTPAKPANKSEIKNSNYFPSTSKQNMNKLDISIAKTSDKHTQNETNTNKITPKSKTISPFPGFENKSIEKSCLVSNEVNKETSIMNEESEATGNNTPVAKYITGLKERRVLSYTPDNQNVSKKNSSYLAERDNNKSNAIFATPGPSKMPDQKLETEQCKENQDDNCFVTIDGEKVLLSKYMQDLRDQGLFDRGSPAEKYDVSPYIAPKIARPNKLCTPKNNQNPDDSLQPSQDTPVGKYIKGLQQRNVLPSTKRISTPDSPYLKSQSDIATPNTPLGAFMCENDPSPETRKYWERRLNRFPHYKMHDRPVVKKDRRLSTPLSEVKRQAWAMLLGNDHNSPGNESVNKKQRVDNRFVPHNDDDDDEVNDEPIEQEKIAETESQIADNIQVTNQLMQIQNMMKSNENSGNRRGSLLRIESNTPQRARLSHIQTTLFSNNHKDSQPDTVGWDDPIEPGLTNQDIEENFTISTLQKPRKFMLSTISNDVKKSYEEIIQTLGGEISVTQYFDPTATHLVCTTPSRNEKVLASMASGKFIVHISYITDSQNAGKFLDEELYEFGNSKSLDKIKVDIKAGPNIEAFHWWRKKITEEKCLAFKHMRIVLFSNNKAALIRLIEAGDGIIVNATLPFTHNIDATHCLIDYKLNHNMADFIPLAKQGIPCLNIIFLSSYLSNLGKPVLADHIPQELQEYYTS